MMAPGWKKFLFPAFLALVLAGGIWGAGVALRDPQEHVHGAIDRMLFQPVEAYDFTLTGQDGQSVRLSQFRGRTVVFAFGFTNCPNICPATLSHFAAIRKALPDGVRDKVQFLFVSLDPERDTPERLKEYVPFFDESFIGLTGDLTAIRGVAYKYKATFTKNPPRDGDPKNYFVDHSADIYLINPEGQWVMTWPLEELAKTDKIAGEITRATVKP